MFSLLNRSRQQQRRTTNAHRRSCRLWVSALEDRTVPATFTVINNSDDVGTAGSLRWALLQAQNTAGADTVDFNMATVTSPLNVPSQFTYVGTDGGSLTIQGPGAGLLTILNTGAASASSRLFNISDSAAGSASINISGLTFSGALLNSGAGGVFGTATNEKFTIDSCTFTGNVAPSGGVFAATGTVAASLTITNSTLSNNTATTGNGGAIAMTGASSSVALTNCTITTNAASATAGGGGVVSTAGATSSITLTNCTISGTKVGTGGGGVALASGATSTIKFDGCNVTNNTASGGQGGVAQGATGPAFIIANNSTFSFNGVTQTAGGVFRTAGNASTSITLTNSIFDNNFTSGTTTTCQGAVVQGSSTTKLSATNCTFSNNFAFNGGGAINVGVTTATLTNCIFSKNSATTLGGAINLPSAGIVFTANSCTFDQNSTGTAGGAIHVISNASVTINNSTFSGNSSGLGALGGGALSLAVGSSTSAVNVTTITNSTFSGNVALGTQGGGAIRIDNAAWNGTLTIKNSTIANNSAPNGIGGGLWMQSSTGTITLNSTIIADNVAPVARDIYSGFPRDVVANNMLIGSNDTSNINLTVGPNDPALIGTEAAPINPQLNPLNNYGGVTNTLALKAASPAVDAGAANGLTTDQRGAGFSRTVDTKGGGALADIGAYEGVLTIPIASAMLTDVSTAGDSTYKVTVTYQDISGVDTTTIDTNDLKLSGSGYPSAVSPSSFNIDTNASTTVTVTYTFTPPGGTWDKFDGGSYTVALNGNQIKNIGGTSALPTSFGSFGVAITGSYLIDENSDVDDGNYGVGKLSIREAVKYANLNAGTADSITFAAALNGQTITLNSGQLMVSDVLEVTGNGQAQTVISGAAVASPFNRIFNVNAPGAGGAFTLKQMTLTGGNLSSGDAGAILVIDDALTLDHVTVSNNKTNGNAGAIAVTSVGGSITITDSLIVSNTGNSSGGAVFAQAGMAVTVTRSTFDKNASVSTSGLGGALASANGSTVTLTDSTFTSNNASTQGGAYQGGSSVILTVNGCLFKGNQSGGNAGALNLGNGLGPVVINTSTFTFNTAVTFGGAINFNNPRPYELNDCVLTNNEAGDRGGAVFINSAAATITIRRSTISGNTAKAGSGGGIYSVGAAMTIIDSTLSSNVANLLGSSSTVPVGGGGLASGASTSTLTTIAVTNTTFSGNTVYGLASAGGAIVLGGVDPVPINLSLINCTLTNNSALVGGGIGFVSSATQLTATSSIIAQNQSATDPDLYSVTTTPTTPTVTFSIIGALTDPDIDVALNGVSNFTGTLAAPVDAHLTPLGSYGGPTPTHGLFPNSPAIDAGLTAEPFDQRGTARPIDEAGYANVADGSDIGAYEGILNIPTAVVGALVDIKAPSAGYTVVVTYQHSVGIDTTTINAADITLTGKGYAVPEAPSAVMIAGMGGSVTVTYTFAAPGGAWDFTDDGGYSVNMIGNQVFSSVMPPLAVQASVLGTFTVAIPTSYVVDNAGDTDDGNYGAGQLTLREAIALANTATAKANDTITFAASLSDQTITLTSGQLVITDSVVIDNSALGSKHLTIKGLAAASLSNRLFNATLSGGTFNVTGLTLTGGNLSAGSGAAILIGGTLIASDLVVLNNSAAGSGGAIFAPAANSTITITNSSFTGNSAGGTSGAVGNGNFGNIFLGNSTFTNNTATGSGGVIATVAASTVTLMNSTFTGNQALSEGGVLHMGSSSFSLTITGSTFAQNTAAGAGGGGFNLGNGTVVVSSSTFTQNVASTGLGGAVKFPSGGSYTFNGVTFTGNSAATTGGALNVNSAADSITLNACTLSGNTATAGGGIYITAGVTAVTGFVNINDSTLNNNVATGVGGGGVAILTGTLNISNSTLSGNTATTGIGGALRGASTTTFYPTININNSTITRNSAGGGGGGLGFTVDAIFAVIESTIIAQNKHATHPDVFSTPTATVGNYFINNSIIGAETDTDYTASGSNNQIGTLSAPINARLAPLGNYGGPTQTHGLLIGSPAVDMGGNPFTLPFDQRGLARTFGANTDVGSVEGVLVNPAASTTLTNVTTAGGTTYVVSVVYTSATAIKTSTIDANDITIPGLTSAGAPVVAGAGGSVTATYTFTPPGGSWDFADNGAYTVSVAAGQVSDTSDNFVLADALGSFQVSIAAPASKVTNLIINGGNAQRSRITTVEVDFDQHVTLTGGLAAAFQLVRASDNATVTFDTTNSVIDDSGAGTKVTLKFDITGMAVDGKAGNVSLADGRYTLTAFSSAIGNANGALDGDGNGTPGGDYVLASAATGNPPTNIFRLFGDSSGDGIVNGTDFLAFRLSFLGMSSTFDIDGSGLVDGTDFLQFRLRFLQSI